MIKMIEILVDGNCFGVYWENEAFQYKENSRVIFESTDFMEVRDKLLESTHY